MLPGSEQIVLMEPEKRTDIEQLFLNDTPLLDVRAEIEFNKGAFPSATNIPILNTNEREQVGIRYKKLGQQAAIDLGAKLVCDEVKEQRVNAWVDFAKAHPEGKLYCFRGGLRSRIAQQWLAEAGMPYPLIAGGYKAMRQFLLEEIELAARKPYLIVSGKTGSGKTRVVNHFAHGVDLEGLGAHRGSAFGRRVEPQPKQIDFENRLAIRLLELRHFSTVSRYIIEDEGRQLGSLSIPLNFFQQMQQSPIALIETTYADRISIVVEEYVVESYNECLAAFGDSAPDYFRDSLENSLQRIAKRLGGERYQVLAKQLQQAISIYIEKRDASPFYPVVERLLKEYYDPMYEYQLGKKSAKVAFRGERSAVLEWLREVSSIDCINPQ